MAEDQNSKTEKPNEIEDIFAETSSAPVLESSSKPEQSKAPEIREELQKPKSSKWTIIIIALAVVTAILLAVSVWIYISNRNQTSNTNSSVLEDQGIQEVLNLNIEPVVNLNISEANNTNQETVEPPDDNYQDSDHDGLSDKAEIEYGTSSEKFDTDDDNLSDREEIKVYLTDPLNPDTDNDGFLDGDEVRGGYNPSGPGYLIDFQDQVNKKLDIN